MPLSERERYQIALTHRLLGEMQRLAAAHGADFRIFYPHNDVDLARKNISCIKDEADGKHYVVDMQDMLEYIDASDLAKLVIAVDISASPEPTTLSNFDTHLNRVGNEKAMDGLANALIRAGKIR